MSRPYASNYAIGFMFVLGTCMLFECMCVLAYPNLSGGWDKLVDIIEPVMATSVVILILAVSLLTGISLGHKITLIFMSALLVSGIGFLSQDGLDFYDGIRILVPLSTIILLATKGCREYYAGWGTDVRFHDE